MVSLCALIEAFGTKSQEYYTTAQQADGDTHIYNFDYSDLN